MPGKGRVLAGGVVTCGGRSGEGVDAEGLVGWAFEVVDAMFQREEVLID